MTNGTMMSSRQRDEKPNHLDSEKFLEFTIISTIKKARN